MANDNEYKVEPEYQDGPENANSGPDSYGVDEGEQLAGERFSKERERSQKLQNDSTDENLTRRRWGRWAGLTFMVVFSLVTTAMIATATFLVYKLIATFTIRELVPTPFPDTGTWSNVLPMLPIFSLSLFALLMFITLARFATDFINEERRGGSQSNANNGSDDAAAIRVLRRLLAAISGK
ncbi:hypothetical protein [Kushneria aurantia]|uniref:Uncharacterized protein n=1 Tax=Kushneria aurantia TaxID=504092 RepID=A0ABV6G301_9GAMM|nr:hypothetical protein [Kushneria aurantia]